MAKFFELKQQQAHAINQADAIIAKADQENRSLSDAELADFEVLREAATSINQTIGVISRKNTLQAQTSFPRRNANPSESTGRRERCAEFR